jgi:hypothetical protein
MPYGNHSGVTGGTADQGSEDYSCYLPNAAIGWKQPNGFYYPPAFNSINLFFDNVAIRHFVIEPLFIAGTLNQDNEQVIQRYCTRNSEMFSGGFTDVDRQTVLNDDDGSLTGLAETISVNEDPFFNAPVETTECRSGIPATAKTSPYDYVTTVIYPKCAIAASNYKPPAGKPALEYCSAPGSPLATLPEVWSKPCSNSQCYGVPLYRQLLTADEKLHPPSPDPSIRMMGSALYQRSNLTVNHGKFYIDTTISGDQQREKVLPPNQSHHVNVFMGGETYYLFLLFAKEDTRQTYEMYVGKNQADSFLESNVNMTRVAPKSTPFTFTPGTWPNNWERSYDPASGILSVTMNLSDIHPEIVEQMETQCLPSSVCKWDHPNSDSGKEKQCITSLTAGHALYEEFVQGEICENAVLAVDCPAGGCYGFSVKFPDDFTTSVSPDPRPAPGYFADDPDFNWNVDWVFPDADLAGDCADPVTAP